MTRTFGYSSSWSSRQVFGGQYWISPTGTLIEVKYHLSHTAKNILKELIGNTKFEHLEKYTLKKRHISIESYLCNNLHYVYLSSINKYKANDSLCICKIPENRILSFEQIEVIHELTGFEYKNKIQLFECTPKYHAVNIYRKSRFKFKRYED